MRGIVYIVGMEEMLTVQQAAQELRMHDAAVRKAIIAGRINAQHYGPRVILITRAEVERYKVERPPRGRKPKEPGDQA